VIFENEKNRPEKLSPTVDKGLGAAVFGDHQKGRLNTKPRRINDLA
jgi:hypothetical protein